MTIKHVATFSESAVMGIAHAAAAAGNTPAVSWLEAYEDFTLFLDDIGATVDALPAWQPSVPVHVIARSSCFWLRQLTPKERKRRARLIAAGKASLEAVPIADLKSKAWHKVTITAIDAKKYQKAQRDKPWER